MTHYEKPGAWYDYLREGERVRYHGGKNYYEKYDKTRETSLPCAGCGSRRDAREDYCGRCGTEKGYNNSSPSKKGLLKRKWMRYNLYLQGVTR